ncbi:lysophospholipid acyltransferase 1-like protein [Tanacetum coccineum]
MKGHEGSTPESNCEVRPHGTIPVGYLHRFVPGGPTGKHVYAALTGAMLSYLSFGFSSNLLFLVAMLVGYGSMVAYRKRALMVLTLKVISCAFNYNDGLLKEEDLRESQKKNGPVYEIKDYLDWTEGKGIWMKSEKGSPSPFGATLKAILQAGLCMGLYLDLVPHYPLSKFTKPIYKEWGFLKKLGYQYMASFTARWKYYFIWSISEASIIISGLGFSGWTDQSHMERGTLRYAIAKRERDSSALKARWDRAKNVDVLGVEFAKSAVEIPLVWNIQVSTWLRHCEPSLLASHEIVTSLALIQNPTLKSPGSPTQHRI